MFKKSIQLTENLSKIYFTLDDDAFDLAISLYGRGKPSEASKLHVAKILLEQMFHEKSMRIFQTQNIRLMNANVEKAPIMGVVTVCKINDKVKLALPDDIPNSLVDSINNELSKVKEMFDKVLIKLGLCRNESSQVVTDHSSITYDLHYTKDGVIINTIEKQLFDMDIDNDIDKNLFLNKQVGDIIILDKNDINIEAEIKEIYNNIPYSEDFYDIEKINAYNFESFKEMEESFNSSYRLETTINKMYDYILDYVCNNTEYEFTEDILEFFKKNYPDANDIKRIIYEDLLKSIVVYETSYEQNFEELAEAYKDMAFYIYTGMYKHQEDLIYFNRKCISQYVVRKFPN